MTMTRIRQTTPEERLTEQLPHLTPNEQDGLATFVDRLRQHYGADLLHVTLFGSKARGDFDNESDLDVLVVVRIPDVDYWQHWSEIVDLTRAKDDLATARDNLTHSHWRGAVNRSYYTVFHTASAP